MQGMVVKHSFCEMLCGIRRCPASQRIVNLRRCASFMLYIICRIALSLPTTSFGYVIVLEASPPQRPTFPYDPIHMPVHGCFTVVQVLLRR